MTLGEKIKEARKQAGFTQEQMAEKLVVSRQAVTKWETDRGVPDIQNMKGIAALLNVSIDYLLNDEENQVTNTIKEAINLDDYEKTGKCRSKEDAVVLAKYNNATSITALIRKKKMSKKEWLLDFITVPGVLQLSDYSNNNSSYYLVEEKGNYYMVNVTKEFIISTIMTEKIIDSKFIIGNDKFSRAYEII